MDPAASEPQLLLSELEKKKKKKGQMCKERHEEPF